MDAPPDGAAVEQRLWHPLLQAQDLQAAPRPLQLLGRRLVLWRDDQGEPVLMHDQCPHRGAQLSLGRVVGSGIECPYHGWRFDGQGRCVAVPALPGFVPPASHQVCTHRVLERHGLIWGVLAEPLAVEPILPAGVPTRRLLYGPFDVAVGAPRVVENFLDTAHFAFVHQGWLGEDGHAEVPDHVLTHKADGRPVVPQYRAWQPRATASAAGGGWVNYRYEVLGPYAAWLAKQPESGEPGDSYALWASPVDDEHCRVFMAQYTSDLGSTDEQLRDFQLAIFAQDQPILESQRPRRLPLSGGELHSAADRLSAAYRRYLQAQGVRCGVC
jgi:phenylpropionate dioxygenase-like ring-hydroxylating dioxygenase large terminal subunit